MRDAFKNTIKPFIENELEMQVKSNYQIFPIAKNRFDKHGRALDYVGYKFYREQKLIRKRIKKKFCKKVSKLNKRKKKASKEYFKRCISPWLGWAKHSNSKNLLNKIIPKEYESVLR